MRTGHCYYCGPTDEELRSYGPGGSTVCNPCVSETPERTEAAKHLFWGLLDANEAISPSGAVAIGEQTGPRPFDPEELL